AALRERGFRTTQATISRDVAELGLIKVSREGTAAYALPPRLIEAETSGEDRRRAGPRPLARGRRVDRRRRHAVRRVPGSRLAAAHQAPAAAARRRDLNQ